MLQFCLSLLILLLQESSLCGLDVIQHSWQLLPGSIAHLSRHPIVDKVVSHKIFRFDSDILERADGHLALCDTQAQNDHPEIH